MVYVGVDLHRKSSHVVALDDNGERVLSRRISSTPPEFHRVFGELAPAPIDVAFEATYGWGWFADLLADAGIPGHMAHPLATKAISSARVKNDAVDASTLAHLLRTNLLPEAWIAPPQVREARLLVRSRCSLRRISSRLKCQVHAIVATHGIAVPATDAFGARGRVFLDTVELPDISRRRLDQHLRLIHSVEQEIRTSDREIRTLFAGDHRIARLQAIPRIGSLIAAVVIAEVWDVTRFPTARHLCSWAGITPSEHSSADRTRMGHITKQGSRWLRWAMVEAASNARVKGDLRALYDRVARRRGAKIATVALAHRLLELCYYAMRDPAGCRAYPVAP